MILEHCAKIVAGARFVRFSSDSCLLAFTVISGSFLNICVLNLLDECLSREKITVACKKKKETNFQSIPIEWLHNIWKRNENEDL